MALPNGTPVDAPSPEPRPDAAPTGRRYTTADGVARDLDRQAARLQQVIANLRANPPADGDLARIGGVAEGVERAVTTLDRALSWREGR